MSRVVKCDVCGNIINYGFSTDIKMQGNTILKNIAEDESEIGQKDICRNCYYLVKKIAICIAEEHKEKTSRGRGR